MRKACRGLLAVSVSVAMLGGLGGLSGCGDGKPSDGTMVGGAPPQSEQQKAMHKKFYDRSKKARRGARR